jgi:hypothetical protein
VFEMNARDFMETIARKCPAYTAPLADCALASLRSQPNAGLDLLSEAEIDDLVRRHFLCVCRKEGCGT